MADLTATKARARIASERARVRLAMHAVAAPVVLAAILACARPDAAAVCAVVVALCAAAAALMTWRRGLGRGAARGLLIGTPIAWGASLLEACMPSADAWQCGVPCLLVGVISALAIQLALPAAPRARGPLLATAAFAAAVAAVACAPFGVGLAATAAVGVAFACAAGARATARTA